MNSVDERLRSVTDSVQKVSTISGAPFVEVLALFESYAAQMLGFYFTCGMYPNFAALLEMGDEGSETE